ncbi:MAG: hypothetical protein L6R41_003874 [Letrouitia leprolyta]|nr:MAG: hypothetical protein L6R41_003874 [Letrouitia leprolyta]
MKPILFFLVAIPYAFSSPLHDRALPNPPAGFPSLNDILAAISNKPGGTCCAGLSYVLGPKVAYPLSVSYTGTSASFWSAQEQSVSPNCVVEPTTTQDVSVAVYILSSLNIYTNFSEECKFGFKSGGHTPQSGAATQPSGVTIDLGSFKQVDVSADRKGVSIGPGNRWADIYTKLDAINLGIPGGRVATVGAGGLILGGGVSYFSGRYGLVCDNIINYELVLPFGKVINVNSSTPDLFKALKGGSNNFGIVTRFDIKSFESGLFWGGQITYPLSTMPQHVSAFVNLANSQPYDPYAALIHSYAFIAGSWVIVNHFAYTAVPANPYPATFKPFTSIQPQISNTLRTSALTDFTIELATTSPPGKRALFTTLTHGLSTTLLTSIYQCADTALQPIKSVLGLVYSLSFQPLPVAIYTKSTSGNPNSLGLDASDGNLALALLTVTWTLASDDAAVTAAANAWLKAAKAASIKEGKGNEYVYLNYAAPGQDPIAGYGSGNRAGLRVVSKKYDSSQIFQRAVMGGFKL